MRNEFIKGPEFGDLKSEPLGYLKRTRALVGE